MQTDLSIAYDHIVGVHEKRPCSTCGEMFSDKRMRRHVMSKHASNDEKPFKCTFCTKGFLTKVTLQEHINTHTGERPNICSFCGIGFVNHSNRRMHERTVHLGHQRDESAHNKSGGGDLSKWQTSKQQVNFMVFKDEEKS